MPASSMAISMRFVYRIRPSYAWSAAVGTLFALHHHNASNTFFRADDLDRGAYHRFVDVYLVHRFPEPVQWEEIESTSSLSALERFVELPAILEPKDPCQLVRIFMRTAREYEPLHEHVAQHWAPRYPRCVSWPR